MRADDTNTIEAPKSEEKPKDTLENLAELLVALYNGASTADISSLARFASSASISTDLLFLNFSVRVMCYAITGVVLFVGAFVYHACAGTITAEGFKSVFEKIFSGRKRDILLSCFSALVGGSLLSSQTNKQGPHKNAVIIGFGYLFVMFAGFVVGGGVSSIKSTVKSLKAQSQEATLEPIDQLSLDRGLPAIDPTTSGNKKDNLEHYLRLILSFRHAAIAGAGTGLTYSATQGNVQLDKLLLNYAMLQLFYGALVNIFTYISLSYDSCCTDRSKRLGGVNIFNAHFSGIKLQITLSGILGFLGALILLIQSLTTKNPVALQIAEWLLSVSGFLTGSKVTAIFAHMAVPIVSPPESHDPLSDNDGSMVSGAAAASIDNAQTRVDNSTQTTDVGSHAQISRLGVFASANEPVDAVRSEERNPSLRR